VASSLPRPPARAGKSTMPHRGEAELLATRCTRADRILPVVNLITAS
jgi:hypothetical protein